MPSSYSSAWSTLGYGALSYFWGIPSDVVDRLYEEERRRLVAFTNYVHELGESDRVPIAARVEGIDKRLLARALLDLADEFLPKR
jgi:hypothetical protein